MRNFRAQTRYTAQNNIILVFVVTPQLQYQTSKKKIYIYVSSGYSLYIYKHYGRILMLELEALSRFSLIISTLLSLFPFFVSLCLFFLVLVFYSLLLLLFFCSSSFPFLILRDLYTQSVYMWVWRYKGLFIRLSRLFCRVIRSSLNWWIFE